MCPTVPPQMQWNVAEWLPFVLAEMQYLIAHFLIPCPVRAVQALP